MIRLSNAQVTLIQEHLSRHARNTQSSWKDGPDVPLRTATEELVEDILKIVLPTVTVSSLVYDPVVEAKWEPGLQPSKSDPLE